MSEVTLDNRGLSPPEPLVRTLEALGGLGEGSVLRVLMDREPILLYPELERRGWAWTFREEEGILVLRVFLRDAPA